MSNRPAFRHGTSLIPSFRFGLGLTMLSATHSDRMKTLF
jgi:hypothetical protein